MKYRQFEEETKTKTEKNLIRLEFVFMLNWRELPKKTFDKMNTDAMRNAIIIICVIGRFQVKSQDILPYEMTGCVGVNSPHLVRHDYIDTRPANIDVFSLCQKTCHRNGTSVFGTKRRGDTGIYVGCYCVDPNQRLATVSNNNCWYTCQDKECGGRKAISLYEDVNECIVDSSVCSVRTECTNTVGGYRCDRCSEGYSPAADNPNQCEDIDECIASTPCGEAICTNTDGSYQCSCLPGYTLNNDMDECIDIDECIASTPCGAAICTNTVGSHQCSCLPGYTPNNDMDECIDINECEEKTSGCEFGCSNNEGSYSCLCQPGSAMINGSCPAASGDNEIALSVGVLSVEAVFQIVSAMSIVGIITNMLNF